MRQTQIEFYVHNANLEEWKSLNGRVQGITHRPYMPRADLGSIKGKGYEPNHEWPRQNS